jgi:uncharacterized RDD family membrane protein YckC
MQPNSPLQSELSDLPLLDTRRQVETPEGIDLILRPAGLMPRALAFGIDLLIRGTILYFLINWWYPVLFEVLYQGRTPGKKAMSLRVVHDDGTPVGWAASLTRNLLRAVDMLPFAYCVGAISSLSHSSFKRLGDLAAGTLVVYQEDELKRPQIPEADVERAPFPLSLAEQRAVMDFAERHTSLSGARRAELASILAEPLESLPEHAEARLHGIARGLVGTT